MKAAVYNNFHVYAKENDYMVGNVSMKMKTWA